MENSFYDLIDCDFAGSHPEEMFLEMVDMDMYVSDGDSKFPNAL